MPIGLVMTIWAAENAVYNTRDDIAFRDTLQAIKDKIDYSFCCERPTVPAGEDLLAEYEHKDFFKKRLTELLESANQTVEETK